MKLMQIELLSNVKHDMVDYEAGSLLEMDENQAQNLIDSHVAVFKCFVDGEAPAKPVSVDIYSMNRPQLNEYAVTLGLDPTKYSSKSTMLEAIIEAQAVDNSVTEPETEPTTEPAEEEPKE